MTSRVWNALRQLQLIQHALTSLFVEHQRVVPDKIRIWQEQQQKLLLEKDAAEEEAKEALKVQAKKELEDWYKRHDESIKKTKVLNR